MSIEQEYDQLLKSGMFFEFFPNLTGNWNEDKDEFTLFVIKRNTQ